MKIVLLILMIALPGLNAELAAICLKSQTTACEDVLIENCRVRSSCNAVKFGAASKVGFKNITIRNIQIYDTYRNLTKVPQQESAYPDASRFGTLPSWGLYVRHAEDIQLDNVTLLVKGTDYRAALVCDDVKNLTLERLNVLTAGKEPVVVLHDVNGATIRNSKPPPKSVRFVEEMGKTNHVKILKSL